MKLLKKLDKVNSNEAVVKETKNKQARKGAVPSSIAMLKFPPLSNLQQIGQYWMICIRAVQTLRKFCLLQNVKLFLNYLNQTGVIQFCIKKALNCPTQ